MADLGAFSDIGGKISEKLFSGIVWFGIGAIIIGVVAVLMYYFIIYKRRFDIKVKIISNRAEDNYSIIFDKAAILRDRETGTNYFKVWGLKRDFPVPKYNVMQRSNEGDYIEIFRKSEDEFYFLTKSEIGGREIIRADGKVCLIAGQKQTLVDPEMGFWAVKRKSLNKKMFSPESLLMKLLPYIPMIMGGVIMIFILYLLLDHLPGILNELRQLVEAMRQMQAGQVIPA